MCLICESKENPNKLNKVGRVLDCYECPLLTNIPVQFPRNINMPWFCSLRALNCSRCPLLTEIPIINTLGLLSCSDCPLLTRIPNTQTIRIGLFLLSIIGRNSSSKLIRKIIL